MSECLSVCVCACICSEAHLWLLDWHATVSPPRPPGVALTHFLLPAMAKCEPAVATNGGTGRCCLWRPNGASLPLRPAGTSCSEAGTGCLIMVQKRTTHWLYTHQHHKELSQPQNTSPPGYPGISRGDALKPWLRILPDLTHGWWCVYDCTDRY